MIFRVAGVEVGVVMRMVKMPSLGLGYKVRAGAEVVGVNRSQLPVWLTVMGKRVWSVPQELVKV